MQSGTFDTGGHHGHEASKADATTTAREPSEGPCPEAPGRSAIQRAEARKGQAEQQAEEAIAATSGPAAAVNRFVGKPLTPSNDVGTRYCATPHQRGVVRRRAPASLENSDPRAGRNSRPRQCRRSRSHLVQARDSVHSSAAHSSPSRSGAAVHRHLAGAADASAAAHSSSAHSFSEFPYLGAHASSRTCDESRSSDVSNLERAPLCSAGGRGECPA